MAEVRVEYGPNKMSSSGKVIVELLVGLSVHESELPAHEFRSSSWRYRREHLRGGEAEAERGRSRE